LSSIVKLPFRKGAKVESADIYGRTALSYAAWNGHVATVKLLLRAGARVNSRMKLGGRRILCICNGHNDVVELLLKKGTQVDSLDDIVKALLLSAAEKGMRRWWSYCSRTALTLSLRMMIIGHRYRGYKEWASGGGKAAA